MNKEKDRDRDIREKILADIMEEEIEEEEIILLYDSDYDPRMFL